MLYIAVEYNNLDAVKMLLEYGVDTNCNGTDQDTGIIYKYYLQMIALNCRPIHKAIMIGDIGLPILSLLVEYGADVNAIANKQHALSIAYQSGSAQGLDILLSHGAYCNNIEGQCTLSNLHKSLLLALHGIKTPCGNKLCEGNEGL